MNLVPAEFIKQKRRGEEHSLTELQAWMNAFVTNQLPDYQMAAWLMAVFFKGMSLKEISHLTQVMRDSGRVLDFSHLNSPCVDKHSTGGVGDKTSLILAPLVGLFGVKVPMIAGRGLGHTGGTLDKLESLKGFRVDLSLEDFQRQVEGLGYAIIGQTPEICPADRKLYALRDVTGTVESLPLICGSIMSKKLAEGLSGLVLDVKFGSGAFMKTLEQARDLAQLLQITGQSQGVKVSALLTDMNQPLGRFIGNSLEVKECLDILEGKSCVHRGVDYYSSCRELTLELAGHMLSLADQAPSPKEGRLLAEKALTDGRALKAFASLCEAQGGDLDQFRKEAAQLKAFAEVAAPRSGYLVGMDCERVGLASLLLGAGRLKAEDPIDPSAGIEVHCRLGEAYSQGEPLFYLYGNNPSAQAEVTQMLLAALEWSEEPGTTERTQPLIAEVLGSES